MLSIRKINPLARAIGTVGVVAGLVAGITFAAQPNNVATLTNNTLTAATANLGISAGQGDTGCTDTPGPSAQGITVTNLVSGGAASSKYFFCLDNTGSQNLNITVGTPTSFSGSTIPPDDVTLNFECPDLSTAAFSDLGTLGTTPLIVGTTLNAGTNEYCSVTAQLTGYSGNGGSITPFELDFTGTPPTI